MALVIATLLDVARSSGAMSGGETCTAADAVALVSLRRRFGVVVDDRSESARGRIAAPAALVARLLQPLVDNAVQHARSSVVIEAADQDGSVLVTVRDDGPGVSEERRTDLFEPGVSGRPEGAGLGLGIARRVASAMGAHLGVERPESGATFTVSLPTR
jgi:signal transduction histidine kinase